MEKIDVFIHIPKAAGSSIRSLIEANYPPKLRVPCYRKQGVELHGIFEQHRNTRLKDCAVVFGHIPVVVHNYTDRHCNYFTFLRDPVARAISEYKFIKHDLPSHPAHEAFSSGKVSFSAYCAATTTGEFYFSAVSKATQLLAGVDRVKGCDDAMLEKAKRTLMNMGYFGFFHDFVVAVEECAAYLGWNTEGYEMRNVSSVSNTDFLAREGATERDIEVLRNTLRHDIELFDFALSTKEKRRQH
ncbi:sulfotransferase family 2 domain-containing protein [Paracoccus sp. MBLB3053]|uniref:Sulfotransferase family 2 domain-containing protein n=1 Tax=Paracoccus aurantius TaxID=3073814 RepID=A0ABU2HQQ5_9RHOB|nr:sulfotransferase family 2 domain-containing protein [Paracoccus sp. MBLB3053]MDS9467384.1 sulfotransferase family 2 domain-containing protein [Paracoccus sp. MBLB3053]